MVDRTGVQPTRVGALPPQCAALNRTFLNVVELTVRAALEGSREHVYHAAMLDPNASGVARPRHDPDDLRRADRRARGRAAAAGVSGLDLLVVGDVNADLVLRGGDLVPAFGQREQLVDQAELVLGGSGAIVAAGAARLGLRVAMAGCVGDDALGPRDARRRSTGVDVAAVRTVDGADRRQRRPRPRRATARC